MSERRPALATAIDGGPDTAREGRPTHHRKGIVRIWHDPAASHDGSDLAHDIATAAPSSAKIIIE